MESNREPGGKRPSPSGNSGWRGYFQALHLRGNRATVESLPWSGDRGKDGLAGVPTVATRGRHQLTSYVVESRLWERPLVVSTALMSFPTVLLLHRQTLRQVAWLIDIRAFQYGDVIRE